MDYDEAMSSDDDILWHGTMKVRIECGIIT